MKIASAITFSSSCVCYPVYQITKWIVESLSSKVAWASQWLRCHHVIHMCARLDITWLVGSWRILRELVSRRENRSIFALYLLVLLLPQSEEKQGDASWFRVLERFTPGQALPPTLPRLCNVCYNETTRRESEGKLATPLSRSKSLVIEVRCCGIVFLMGCGKREFSRPLNSAAVIYFKVCNH